MTSKIVDAEEAVKAEKYSMIRMKVGDKITVKKMRCLVREFGSFPSTNRAMVWRYLLEVPQNHVSFKKLALKAVDTDLPDNWASWISQQSDLRSSHLSHLNRTLKWLIAWSRELTCLDFLPQFVLPFCSIFGNDPISCFEVVASAIVNWGELWLEMCNEPPFQLMTLIEELLFQFGPGALKNLKKNSVSIVSYAWPLFETGFAVVLPDKKWRQLWDHIVCNKPAFYISAGIAFVCCTETLLRELTATSSSVKDLFAQEHDIDMKVLLRKSYEIFDYVSNWPPQLTNDLFVLPTGKYSSLEQLVDKKAQILKTVPHKPAKQLKNVSPDASIADEFEESEQQACTDEIMSALMMCQRIRGAVDSWKGGAMQLYQSDVLAKSSKKRSKK